ncbi:MAG: M48 family metallopeptidase [Candidatus Peribacteraceae bacterium]
MSLLPYRIERTRNRTSRAMLEGDTVVIRLAGRLPVHEEQRHIATLLKRMTKVHAKLQGTPRIDPFRELLRGKAEATVTLAGPTSPEGFAEASGAQRTFSVSPGNRTRAAFKNDRWIITRSLSITEPAFHRFLWRLLAMSEQPRIETTVQAINDATLRVTLTRVRLRFMRVRWGSSSRRKSINLNTALLFVPPPLLRYVVIHELMHQKHPDHSPRFWRAVESILPDYRDHTKMLKRYRLPQV